MDQAVAVSNVDGQGGSHVGHHDQLRLSVAAEIVDGETLDLPPQKAALGLEFELAGAVPRFGFQLGAQGTVYGPNQVQVAVLVQIDHHDAFILIEDPVPCRIGPDREGAVVLQVEPVPNVPTGPIDALGAPPGP